MKLKTLLFLVLPVVAAGCSPRVYGPPNITHGATYLNPPSMHHTRWGGTSRGGAIYGVNDAGDKYLLWHHNRFCLEEPQAAVNAVGFVNVQGKPRITLAANIVCASLAFSFGDSGKAARLVIRIRLTGASVDTTTTRSMRILRRRCHSVWYYHQHLRAPAGRYRLKVQITDQGTGRQLTRIVRTLVPRFHPEEPTLGPVRMQAKTDDGSWLPVAGYNIPARIDSVAFSVRLTGDTSGAPLQLQARLLRFRADTSIARPYYALPYHKSSLVYQGIDYGDSTVVHSDRRQWAGPGSVVIQFRFARPRRGNYRFAVQTAGNTKALYKARDFGVKSLNFPAVRTPSERAAPLACLMRGKYLHDHPKLLKKIKSPEQAVRLIPKDSSYSKLMALTDPDSLCSVVARFWQDRLGWGQKAQRVEQLYYRRVETANVLFSDYKAGWKTGRGMTYILFGRPCDVWYFPKLSFSGQTPAAHGHDIFGWDYGDCHYNCGYLITSCVGINDYSGTFNHGVAHYGVGFYAPHGNSPRFPFQRCLIVRGARYRFKLRHPHAIKTPRDDITADLIREVQRQRQLWFSGKILHRKLYWLPLSGKMTGGPAFYDSTTDRMAY